MQCISSLFLCLLGCFSVTGYIPITYYLDEKCDKDISFTNDVRIKLTRFSSTFLKRNFKCHVVVHTRTPLDHVSLRFRDLHTVNSVACTINRLVLTDSNGVIMTGANGVCGFVRPTKIYDTTGNSIMLDFTTTATNFQTGNFDVLITSFNYGTTNGSCKLEDYKCENKKCISNDLTCDGYNNCGDDSDEIDGCGLSKGVIIGAGIGAFVFLVIILFVIICGRRRYYSHYHHGGDDCHTTVTTTRSYQNF